MNPARISISIVCACRDEAAHIAACLDSLVTQDLPANEWEAIIADGMSKDGTQDIVTAYAARYPQLTMIENPGRIVSTGLNAAIRTARGEYIVRMDAHTRYAPDYCRRSVEALEKTGADTAGGPARTIAGSLRGRAIAAAFHSRFSTGGARFHDETYQGWVDTVPYGCWRKQTLLAIGLFDEALVRNQDDELNLRLVRAGGRIWQSPAIRSWYAPRPSLSSLWRQYFQYGFWKVAVIRKHRLPGSWRHLVPCAFVVANLGAFAGAAAALMTGKLDYALAIGYLWAAAISAYSGLIVLASASVARREGFELFPLLPAVFAVYHLSYGLGFSAALWRSLMGRRHMPEGDSVFTQTTR